MSVYCWNRDFWCDLICLPFVGCFIDYLRNFTGVFVMTIIYVEL